MANKKKLNTSSNTITNLFRDVIAKEELGTEDNNAPNYNTSIDILDYYNGSIDENNEINSGFEGGKIITIIGKSGSGKTTLGLQIAKTFVEDYDNGQIIHLDYENATTLSRFKTLSKWSNETINDKYIHLNTGVYSETLYKIIKATAKIKLNNYDDIKIDSGKTNINGEPIFYLPPTVVLVDSWATVVPEYISEEEELSGSMSASAIAKTNNAIIKRIIQPMKKANITLIIINHITQKIEIGPIKTSNALNYLGQDESIPGGSSAIYMCDSLIKVQASTKLEPDKDYGIKGFHVIGQFLKSRSNSAGRKFELVFDQVHGFDNVLSNFKALKDAKLLRGNGRAYYFDFDTDTKFTQKNIKELYNKNKEWAEAFDEYVKDYLYQYLNSSIIEEDDESEVILTQCVDKENDIWLGDDDNYYYGDGTPYEDEEE